jgi:hypothetical protein
MKVLLIQKAEAANPMEPVWEALAQHCTLDKVAFGKCERADYAGALAARDLSAYDRVLIWQNIKWIGAQYPALRKVPNLVFYEHDTCQHFVPESTWHGKFEVVFRDIGKVRLIVSNRTSERTFRAAGIDCAYLPKAYNPAVISNLEKERDIEFGHVGRTNTRLYKQRLALLRSLAKQIDVQLLRTEDGDFVAYNTMLNRIRFFISADIGFNEYMSKNFEAMAAGCVLVAKRQPAIEQEALGFVDMENVVLYDARGELVSKVRILQRDVERAKKIAEAGQQLVQNRHAMAQRGTELFQLLRPEIGTAPPPSAWEKFRTLKLSLNPVW